jgi:Ca2+-binding EF-hand superfamily protein
MKEFLIGSAAIVLAGAAFAQAPMAEPAPAPHAAAHAPGAEHVQTRDQVVAKVREHFARLDTNRDGALTQAEADAGQAMMKQRIVQKLGERGDRKLKMQHRDPTAAFDRLDADKNGSISRDEFAKGHEMRIERRVERRGGDAGAPGAPRAMKMHRMGGMGMGGHMFAMADANKDGRVTLQEATDAAVRHFDMADANRDGRITPDERMQMHRQMREQHHPPKAG